MKKKTIDLFVIITQILACLTAALNVVFAYIKPTENVKTPWVWIFATAAWLVCVILNIVVYRKNGKD